MEEKKTSKSQVKASRAWEERNREKVRHDSARRNAKGYIKNHATLEELEELRGWIAEKESILLLEQ